MLGCYGAPFGDPQDQRVSSTVLLEFVAVFLSGPPMSANTEGSPRGGSPSGLGLPAVDKSPELQGGQEGALDR